MPKITIKNANLASAQQPADNITLHIADTRIVAMGKADDTFEADITLDAAGKIVSAGFIDTYARLREPGFEKKATIASEARAAALGGITTLFCSPDTDPVIDEAATVEFIKRCAQDAGYARILPLAATTQALQGEQLSELATLARAGCVAATNADKPIADLQVIRSIMDYAQTFGIVLVISPVDAWLTGAGCAHEGATACRLGLPSIPVAAETVALAMLTELAWQTGARIHLSRVSSKRGCEMIADAKAAGLQISADTSINHLFLDDTCLSQFDSQYRSTTPFRSIEDRDALRAAVLDGTLDIICSDHSPHERDAKLVPFQSAAAGLSSLDTFLPLLLRLADETGAALPELLKSVTSKPAEIFGLEQGTLEVGKPADLILIDAKQTFSFGTQQMRSAGKNSPWIGNEMRGKVASCIVEGVLLEE